MGGNGQDGHCLLLHRRKLSEGVLLQADVVLAALLLDSSLDLLLLTLQDLDVLTLGDVTRIVSFFTDSMLNVEDVLVAFSWSFDQSSRILASQRLAVLGLSLSQLVFHLYPWDCEWVDR